MDDANEFVTILTSSNPQYLDAVIAMLDAEGIPCEHAGRNHTALIPGFSFIQVQLRVPESRRDEAVALLADMPDPTADKEVGMSFRTRRTRRVVGTFLGLGIGVAIVALGTISGVRLPMGPLPLYLILGSAIGFAIGERKRRDICSLPGCAQALAPADKTCPRCGSLIAGRIQASTDHYSALEDFQKPDIDSAS